MDNPPAWTSYEVLLTLAITAGAVVLFVWNRLRVDVAALLVMAALIVAGLLSPVEGLSGFSNEATVTVALMLVISAGLLRTGAMEPVGRWLERLAGKGELRLLLVLLALVVPASAFLNNTAAVAILLPVVMGLSRKLALSPSRLLMPLSFGSQLGGTLTLIGTSTNLLVAGLVLDLGLERIGLFTITPPALILAAIGVGYLVTVGRGLTPAREPAAEDPIESYELREYLSSLVVEPDSRLVGMSLAESKFGEEYGLQIAAIERDGDRIPAPHGSTVLEAGDLLLVEGKVADIARIREADGLRISETKAQLERFVARKPADRRDLERMGLAELMVPPRSRAVGKRLRNLALRSRYGITALALQRHGQPIHNVVGRIRLQPGDLLLVQGEPSSLNELHREGELTLLGRLDLPETRRRKLRLALGIMAGVVLLPAFGVVPILVSALVGALAMVLTGCVTPREAYEDIDWMVIVLLGAILPLGIAMQKTGTATLLAGGLVGLTQPLGPHGVLAAFYVLAVVLTSVLSNNATAVLLTPVAAAAGVTLGVSPLPFIVAVMLAASSCFLTPIGYQTNAYIFGPGGFRFADFVKVGGPLNALLAPAATLVIPIFFPF